MKFVCFSWVTFYSTPLASIFIETKLSYFHKDLGCFWLKKSCGSYIFPLPSCSNDWSLFLLIDCFSFLYRYLYQIFQVQKEVWDRDIKFLRHSCDVNFRIVWLFLSSALGILFYCFQIPFICLKNLIFQVLDESRQFFLIE